MRSEQGLILVVDDEEFVRDILARLLELEGYAVVLAKSGRQALEMMQAQAFDLVLLDKLFVVALLP